MGVGTLVKYPENIALGVDMLDCVMPTRNAHRHAIVERRHEHENAKWKTDSESAGPRVMAPASLRTQGLCAAPIPCE